MVAAAVVVVGSHAWNSYWRWKYVIKLTLPDGSPAAHASVTLWLRDGRDYPVNHSYSGLGYYRNSKWPTQADADGIFPVGRRLAHHESDLYVVVVAWKDGQRYRGAMESSTLASWPMRISLYSAR